MERFELKNSSMGEILNPQEINEWAGILMNELESTLLSSPDFCRRAAQRYLMGTSSMFPILFSQYGHSYELKRVINPNEKELVITREDNTGIHVIKSKRKKDPDGHFSYLTVDEIDKNSLKAVEQIRRFIKDITKTTTHAPLRCEANL